MSVKTPPAPPLPAEVDRLLRRLRMPYVRHGAPEVLATAKSQRWDPAEVLRVLLCEEAAGRDRATIRMRRRSSGLPAGKTFDAWNEAAPIPAATQQALRTLEWIGRFELRQRRVLTPSTDPSRKTAA
jgi:DNA replication protein DnaC